MLKLIKEISKKPRVAGTKQCDKIRDILIRNLESIGFEITTQKVPFSGWELIKKPRLKINGKNVEVLPVIWSGSTKGLLKGELKKAPRIKTFEAYQWIRYKIISGKKTKGYVITRPDTVWLQLVDKKSDLPYFMVRPKTCKELANMKNIKIEASVKSKIIKNQHIYNIITKNNSDKRIVVCAHYDSILNAPGANDNASGVGALMEVAKTNKNVQFILFSAEEFNKYGSYAYVRSLKKRHLEKIKLLINIDMIGHGKPYCICSENLEKKIRAILPKSIKIITKPGPPFDYWPFYKKGVNIVHFGSSPYDYCHTPKDTIDKIQLKPMKDVVKFINKIIETSS